MKQNAPTASDESSRRGRIEESWSTMPQAAHSDASSVRLDGKIWKNSIAQLIGGGAPDDTLSRIQDNFEHHRRNGTSKKLTYEPASVGASNGNGSPLALVGEQAKARVETARANSQSLAEQFAGSIVGEILYARLFCGLRFFNKNHKITTEFPPCSVKQVCSIIATAKSQGRTTEEILPEEVKLASNGLEKLLNAAPHALCFTCANRFCPIKKKIS